MRNKGQKKKLRRFARLSLKEQGLFAERLSLLLGVSMPLSEAVGMLGASFGKGRIAAFQDLCGVLESGMSFERALRDSGLGLSGIVIAAARIGEAGGTLNESMAAAARDIDRRRAMRSSLLSAISYPAIVLVAAVSIIAFLVLFIMPKITPTIESLHVPLPIVTVFFIFLSNAVGKYWGVGLLAISVVTAGVLFLYSKWFRFRSTAQSIALRTPLLSSILKAHALSESFGTIATLTASGSALVESVGQSGDLSGLIPYRRTFSRAVSDMRRGVALSDSLAMSPKLFPVIVTQSLSVGERSGEMSLVLSRLSAYYSRELESSLTALSKIVEPGLMVFVGIVVGAAALSIVMPIYQISQHLSG